LTVDSGQLIVILQPGVALTQYNLIFWFCWVSLPQPNLQSCPYFDCDPFVPAKLIAKSGAIDSSQETGFLLLFWNRYRDFGKKPGFSPHGQV